MMKLELKHLAAYLPYGLLCQYEGVINGKELAKWHKIHDHRDLLEPEEYPYPGENKGIKTAPLKRLSRYKKHWEAECGIHRYKKFRNGFGMKPILYPIQMLSDEIRHNGNSFVPIVELLRMAHPGQETSGRMSEVEYRQCPYPQAWFRFSTGMDIHMPAWAVYQYPYWIIQKLLEWHFDIFGLIAAGLAIDKTTLKTEK